jgi:hypothetical protein
VEEYIKERYGENMGYEKICECGARLDPGEKCDFCEAKRSLELAKGELREKEVIYRADIVTSDNVVFQNAKAKYLLDNSVQVMCQGRIANISLDEIKQLDILD